MTRYSFLLVELEVMEKMIADNPHVYGLPTHAAIDTDGDWIVWPFPKGNAKPLSHIVEDVVPGRSTGLLDINGRELFDGDCVENLNIPSRLERYGQVRLTHLGKYTYWSAGYASIQTLASDPKFGVRKVGVSCE